MRLNKENLRTNASLILLILVSMVVGALAQTVMVEINDLEPEEIEYAGFKLNSRGEVNINVVSGHLRGKSSYLATAWILNAENRDVVWELTDSNSKWMSRKLRNYKDAVELPAGSYEVYFSVFPGYYYNNSGWSGLKNWIMGSSDRDDDDSYEEYSLKVLGNGTSINKSTIRNNRESIQRKALVSIFASRDDLYKKQGFKVNRDTELMIYALGEARDDGSFDYGWIINTDTRERVWQMDYMNTDEAGGAKKNRMYKRNISFPKGNYALYYVSDDSHSPLEWNASPPYDPEFWGVSIYSDNSQAASAVELFDYEEAEMKNLIVDFSRLGDDEFRSEGFTLTRDMNVRVYAVGEGRHGEMFDYAWITKGNSRDRVWEMDYYETEHAGGASKNRLYDGVIRLKKGSYVANFVTDDSHSYRDWNSAQPFDPEHWGMTIMSVEKGFNSNKDVQAFSEDEDKDVLARIARVGDDKKLRKSFKLDKDGSVRVYAVGEGRGGHMYDFAWIEDRRTGRVVWEMTYRMTEHAGGSKKNRLFDGSVFLKSGEYEAVFETDDSHSFQRWNAAAPHDPRDWGVTVYKASSQ
ncbi:MAG: hypothetical protein AAFP70_04245 [Calditrichota bacterium]